MNGRRHPRLFKKVLGHKICNTHFVKYEAKRFDGTRAWVTKYDFEGPEQQMAFEKYRKKFSPVPQNDEDLEVEKILTHRIVDGFPLLLLKWKDYPHAVNHSERWEEDIPKCKEIVDEYWRTNGNLYDRVTGLRKDGQEMGEDFTFDVKMEEVEGDVEGENPEEESSDEEEEEEMVEPVLNGNAVAPSDSIEIFRTRIRRSLPSAFETFEFVRDEGQIVRFDVVKKLACGGFGEVYEFKNHQGHRFAAKVMMWPDMESITREREAFSRIAGRVHVNLLQLVMCEKLKLSDTDELRDVFVLPLMGKSVVNVMKEASSRTKHPPVFPMKTIMSVASQIADGMAHLQSLNIYHLDLKTDNVLFQHDLYYVHKNRSSFPEIMMRDEKVVIADYGRAALSEEELGERGATQPLAYRAPEPSLGLPLTEKSDVWSLGVLMAEMYTANFVFYAREKGTKKEKEQSFFEMILGQTQQELTPELLQKVTNPEIKLKQAKPFTPKKLLLKPRKIEDQPMFDLLKKMFILDESARPSFEEIQAETVVYKRVPEPNTN